MMQKIFLLFLSLIICVALTGGEAENSQKNDNTTVVSKMDAPKDYDNYEVQATIKWNNTYLNCIYNLEVDSNIGEDNIIIQFNNLGTTDIQELEYMVVFYNEGNIVDTSAAKDLTHVGVEKVSLYKKKFDVYEIYINQAHTFLKDNMNGDIVKDSISENIGKQFRNI